METKQELLMLNGKEYLLDIEQAEKLGLLRKKDGRVKSWDEYIKKYLGIHGYSYNITANMITHSGTPIYTADQLTQHEAKALSAFSKLLKLRRDWVGEWESDWSDGQTSHGIIWLNKNKIQANTACTIAFPLSFPDYKMAHEFLETFHDLIEEAKTLI